VVLTMMHESGEGTHCIRVVDRDGASAASPSVTLDTTVMIRQLAFIDQGEKIARCTVDHSESPYVTQEITTKANNEVKRAKRVTHFSQSRGWALLFADMAAEESDVQDARRYTGSSHAHCGTATALASCASTRRRCVASR